MKTHNTPAGAGDAAGLEACIAEKMAWLETCDGALDARGVVVLNEVYPAFMRANHRRVRRRFLIGDVPEADVEDLLQECFKAHFYRVKDHGAKDGLGRLLSKIAKGKYLNYKRDQELAPKTTSMPSSGSALPESEVDVDRAVYFRALARRFLDELSWDHRQVVNLIILEDRSITEASAMLGLPEGTVSSRLRAARAVLRALGDEWLTPSQQRDAA